MGGTGAGTTAAGGAGVRRPLLAVAVACAAGIAAAEAIGAAPGPWWALATLGAAIALVRGLATPAPRAALLCVVGLAAGGALRDAGVADRLRAATSLADIADGTLVRAEVEVTRAPPALAPAAAEGTGLPPLRPAAVVLEGRLVAVDAGAGWRVADGPVRVSVARGSPDAGPGERIRTVARLVRTRPDRNPGAPPASSVMRHAPVAILAVSGAEAVTGAGPAPGWLAAGRRAAGRTRAALEGWLAAALAPRDAALLACLVLGDRDAVPPDAARPFVRSGTAHVLAVSGLHVVIVLAAWRLLLAAAGVRWRLTLACLAALALAYGAVAGFVVPVARAVVMAGLALGAGALGRRFDGWSALGAAACLLLAWEPMALFRPGFQLSFVAVASLLLAAGPLAARFAPPDPLASLEPPRPRLTARRWLAQAMAASLAATVGTAPIVWAHFGQVTPVALVANLIVIPLVSILLVGGLAALPFLAVGGFVASLAAVPLAVACAAVRGSTAALAALPGASIGLPPPSGLTVAGCLAAFVYVATGRAARHPRVTLAGLALAGAAALHGGPAADPPPGAAASVTVLDVGQGSAALLRTSAGHRILVDAGSSSLRDGAASTLARALRALGCLRLDLLVLSHADADHVNAVPALVEDFPVGQVWAGPEVADRPAGRALLAWLVARGIPVRTVEGGDRLAGLPAGTTLEVCHPPAGALAAGMRRNEASLVLRFAAAGRVVLLPGDIEERGTGILLQNAAVQGWWPVDALLAPHHGAECRLVPALLDAARPRIVVASAGRAFDTAATEAAAAERRIPLLNTRDVGPVRFLLRPEGIVWTTGASDAP